MDGKSYIKDLINQRVNFLVPKDVQEILKSFSVPDYFGLFGGDVYQDAVQLIDSIITHSGQDEDVVACIEDFAEVNYLCNPRICFVFLLVIALLSPFLYTKYLLNFWSY